MGTTLIGYFKKLSSGVVFSEGFENDNFIVANGWTTIQGTPGTSVAQAKGGIKSWDNVANAGLPIAKKVITDTTGIYVAVWFYDDAASTTAGTGPYLKVKLHDGKYLQIGVRNSISTTQYVCNAPATYTADNFAVPSGSPPDPVTRQTGWHLLEIKKYGNYWRMDIDSNLQFLGTISSYITEIYLCAAVVGDTAASFGYFDEVLLSTVDTYFTVYTPNYRNFALWEARQAHYYSDYSGPVSANPRNLPLLNFYNTPGMGGQITWPFNMQIQISKYNQVGVDYTRLEFISQWLTVYPGDVFEYISVDLGRKASVFKPTQSALAESHQSTSGVTETIFNAYKNKYIFGANILEGFDLKGKLNDFYAFASKGYPFSINLDTSKYVCSLCSWIVAGKIVYVNYDLTYPGSGTTNFVVGRKYLIFNEANTVRQVLTLASKTPPLTLTFDEVINEQFIVGENAYISEFTYYPFLELGQNPDGFQMTDERYIRFNWIQNCQDYNGG